MSEKAENPPAFPVPVMIVPQPGMFTTAAPNQPGMSLRDYFAACALNGLLAHQPLDNIIGLDRLCPDGLSEYAFEFADAMLAARNQHP